MLHINRRHALAGLAATAVSGRAMAQPATFTTNMYGGRWENTWRQKGLPPFSKTMGRPGTPDIGLVPRPPGHVDVGSARLLGPQPPRRGKGHPAVLGPDAERALHGDAARRRLL